MDNLAHSLTGAVVAVALLPDLAEKKKARVMWAGAVVANIPDLDLLIAVLGEKIYHYHHRGFTHSILGLLILNLPLAYWLTRIILKEGKAELSSKRLLTFIYLQLCFSHYFLDYLTTYGTMFLYPNMSRFAYPLMFIIDPLFWLITGAGTLFLALRKNQSAGQLRRVAFSCFTAIALLWSFELFQKTRAEAIYREKISAGEIESYPWLSSLLSWKVVGKTKSGFDYKPAIVSFRRPEPLTELPIPQHFTQDALCPELQVNEKAQAEFALYQRWAERTVCQWKDPDCLCQSLKYSVDPEYQEISFGGFRIAEGEANFFRQMDSERSQALLQLFLLGQR